MFAVMAMIGRKKSTSRFVVRAEAGSKGFVIEDKRSGKVLKLKGYGIFKGQYAIKKGFDLTRPIAAQAAKRSRTKATGKASSGNRTRRRVNAKVASRH
jgi:hypothetical protein